MDFKFNDSVWVAGKNALYLAKIDEFSSLVGWECDSGLGWDYKSKVVLTNSIKRTYHGIPPVSESLFNLWFHENIGMGEMGEWQDMLSDNNIPDEETHYERFLHLPIKEQYQIINNGYYTI